MPPSTVDGLRCAGRLSPSCHQAKHRRHRRFDGEGDPDRVPQAAAVVRCPVVVSRYGPTDRDPRLPHLPACPDHAGAGRAEGLPASRGPPGRGSAPRGGRAAGRGQRPVLHPAGARRRPRRHQRGPGRHLPRPAARRRRTRPPVQPGPRRQRHRGGGTGPAPPGPAAGAPGAAEHAGGDERRPGLHPQRPPGHPRRQRPGPGPIRADLHQPGPAGQRRPLHLPGPRRRRVLPRLGRRRRPERRHPTRRGRPQPLRQSPVGPDRRAVYPRRHLPAALGPARSPAAPRRRQAPEPPARRADDVHLRDHGARRRRGPVSHRVRCRTRQPGRGCAQPAGQLERHRQRRKHSAQAETVQNGTRHADSQGRQPAAPRYRPMASAFSWSGRDRSSRGRRTRAPPS